MRLGWQTTGDGLVYRGAIGDTATLDPSGLNNAWMLLDTANGNLYAYRAKAWRLVSGGGGSVSDTLTGEVKGPLDSTYIDTVANIIFTTTTDTTVGVGELKYNDTQGSLIQGLKGGNVTNVIGQQIHQRVTNATGGPLTKGTAVFLHGSQGNRITVRKALATADSTSANTFGIVAESIADNQSGYVITEGLITNMNTNALTEGAAVYLSPTVAGELTTTKPQAPQHTVYIGVCVKQHTGSGELFVKIRNGQELDELHDVRIDSPVSNASLYYNTSESVWRDTTAAALKSDISGTTNYLAKFTGSNAVGNSVAFETGRNLYINSTQGNTSNALNNSFEFNGYGSAALDQPFLAVIGNVGVADYRPRLAMYRTKGTTVNDRTLVPFNHHLGSIMWNAADGVDMFSTGAEITAITDSITGENDMPTALTFATTANGAASTTERMRITSNGLVGIRNPTPVNILDVGHPTNSPLTDATIGLTSTLSAGTSKLALANGTVVKGDVLTTSNATVIGTGGMAIQTTTNHPIIFRTNSSGVESGGNERMRITEGGNVGIATSSPSRPLHVNANSSMIIPSGATGTRPASGADGDIRFNSTVGIKNLEWYNGAAWREPVNAARSPAAGLANRFSKFDASGLLDTSAVLTQANGRIGIFNSPAAGDSALTVTGGIRATTGVRATRFSFNTFPTQVVSINNFAPNNSPGNNLFIGNGGRSSTWASGDQGSYNVGLATGSLFSNTTGSHNYAIGFNSLNSNLSGNFNSSIGTFALTANSSGNENIAIGFASLATNTSGNNNTAFSTFSLYKNTTGSGNVAIGSNALFENTQGDFNNAIGNGSLYSLTTGSFNTAIGNSALNNIKTKSGNVGIADLAGSKINGGANNESSENSIFIGYDTKASSAGNTNEIVIGYQAVGNGSNTATIGGSTTTATIFQYGETRLGMAVDSGAYTLQVNGNTKLIGNLARKKPVTIADSTYTVLSDDSWLICNHTAQIKITLPTAANSIGRELMIKYVAGGGATVISNATNVSPIVGGALTNIILPATAGSWVTLVCDGANWIIMQKG